MQIVTGLESLLKTEGHQATLQFAGRGAALADVLGLDGDAIDWEAVYDARYAASHGADIELFAPPGRVHSGAPAPEVVNLVASTQGVLWAAVRRAIEDGDFRASFADEHAVRAAWPL